MPWTLQTLFDRVSSHLLAQGKRAVDPDNGVDGGCAYRSPDGLKCAVGCLIPDHAYHRSMEGVSVNSRCIPAEQVRAAAGIPEDDATMIRLAGDLQDAHDNAPVCEWPSYLATIATRYGLTFTPTEPA